MAHMVTCTLQCHPLSVTRFGLFRHKSEKTRFTEGVELGRGRRYILWGTCSPRAASTLLSGQWETSQGSPLNTNELISLQADHFGPSMRLLLAILGLLLALGVAQKGVK